MTDLPTKDEVVERITRVLDDAIPCSTTREAHIALDALTVPDLLALLRKRGCSVETIGREARASAWMIVVPEKPDAV